jgi:hypothetical protein
VLGPWRSRALVMPVTEPGQLRVENASVSNWQCESVTAHIPQQTCSLTCLIEVRVFAIPSA